MCACVHTYTFINLNNLYNYSTPDPNTFKAVMQAFFVSAIKVWKDVVNLQSSWHVSGKVYGGDMKVENGGGTNGMDMETASNSSRADHNNKSK